MKRRFKYRITALAAAGILIATTALSDLPASAGETETPAAETQTEEVSVESADTTEESAEASQEAASEGQSETASDGSSEAALEEQSDSSAEETTETADTDEDASSADSGMTTEDTSEDSTEETTGSDSEDGDAASQSTEDAAGSTDENTESTDAAEGSTENAVTESTDTAAAGSTDAAAAATTEDAASEGSTDDDQKEITVGYSIEDASGAAIDGAESGSFTFTEEVTLSEKAPVIDGYTLEGAYLDGQKVDALSAAEIEGESVSIVFRYQKTETQEEKTEITVSYTVTDLDGNAIEGVEGGTFTYTDSVILADEAPWVEGYTFEAAYVNGEETDTLTAADAVDGAVFAEFRYSQNAEKQVTAVYTVTDTDENPIEGVEGGTFTFSGTIDPSTQAPVIDGYQLEGTYVDGEKTPQLDASAVEGEEIQLEFRYEAVSSENTQTEYTYEDDSVKVTATLSDPNAVPADATFQVTALSSDFAGGAYLEAANENAEAIDSQLAEAAAASGTDAFTTENTVLYDIGFFVEEDGTKKEVDLADGTVSITMEFKQDQLTSLGADSGEDVGVVHLPLSNKGAYATAQDATDISASDITVDTVDASASAGENAEDSISVTLDNLSLVMAYVKGVTLLGGEETTGNDISEDITSIDVSRNAIYNWNSIEVTVNFSEVGKTNISQNDYFTVTWPSQYSDEDGYFRVNPSPNPWNVILTFSDDDPHRFDEGSYEDTDGKRKIVIGTATVTEQEGQAEGQLKVEFTDPYNILQYELETEGYVSFWAMGRLTSNSVGDQTVTISGGEKQTTVTIHPGVIGDDFGDKTGWVYVDENTGDLIMIRWLLRSNFTNWDVGEGGKIDPNTTVVMTDTLPAGFYFTGGYETQIYDAAGSYVNNVILTDFGGTITFSRSADCSLTDTSLNDTVTIRIPAEKYVEYTYNGTTYQDIGIHVVLNSKWEDNIVLSNGDYVSNTARFTTEDGKLDETHSGSVQIHDVGSGATALPAGTLQIYKRITDTYVPIQGVTFEVQKLTDENAGNFDTSWNNGQAIVVTTNEQGIAQLDDLVPGYYQITETNAPDWIVKPSETIHVVQLSGESGTSQTIYNDIRTTDVVVNKTWSGVSEDDAPAVMFRLLRSEDGVNFSEINSTDEKYADKVLETGQTSVTWEDLPLYNSDGTVKYTYSVKELAEDGSTLTGFTSEVGDTVETVIDGSYVQTIGVTNKQATTSIQVRKVWGVGAYEDSVQVQLLKDGADTDTIVTLNPSNDWTAEIDDLVKYNADGTEIAYTVKELNADEYNQTITGNAADGFTITNTLKTTDLQISKQDENGAALSGAHLQILKDGTVVYDWISSDAPYEISELQAGTYTFHEESAPEGYLKIEDFTFEVAADGKVSITSGDTDTAEASNDGTNHVLTVTDQSRDIEISKVNFGGEKIQGAVIEILGEDGSSLEGEEYRWTSEEGQTHTIHSMPAGNYIFHEESAPDGYTAVDDFGFTVSEDGTITISDPDGSAAEASGSTMTVTDSYTVEVRKTDADGNELGGAVLTILDANGTELDRWTSDGVNPHTVENVTPGVYTLHEESAPDGYEAVADFTFTVADDGNIQLADSGTTSDYRIDEDGRLVVIDAAADTETPVHYYTSVSFTAQKLLDDGAPGSAVFTFELCDADGNVIRTADNNADGSISFGSMTYSETDIGKTFTYRIRERAGSDAGYVYDGSTFGVTVVISQESENTLAAEVTYPDGNAEFHNTTVPEQPDENTDTPGDGDTDTPDDGDTDTPDDEDTDTPDDGDTDTPDEEETPSSSITEETTPADETTSEVTGGTTTESTDDTTRESSVLGASRDRNDETGTEIAGSASGTESESSELGASRDRSVLGASRSSATGDESDPGWFIMLLAAGAVLVIWAVAGKRRNRRSR